MEAPIKETFLSKLRRYKEKMKMTFLSKLRRYKEKMKMTIEKWRFKLKKLVSENYSTWLVILWNSLLCYLFFGFLFNDYSYKAFLFSFAAFMIYQMLLGDTKDTIAEIKWRNE